jgi:AhpD family alkylhydroperoxidase
MSALSRIAQTVSRRRFGKDLGPIDAMEPNGKVLMGYAMFESMLERSTRMDESLKHLAVMKTAAMVGCEWCIDFGTAEYLAAGMTADELRDLPTYAASDRFSALDKLVLDYATGMSRTPVAVDDALVARLRDELGDPGLVELTNIIALENLRARFNWALGIGAQGFSERAVCVVPA